MSCYMRTSVLSLQSFCRFTISRRFCGSATKLNLSVPEDGNATKLNLTVPKAEGADGEVPPKIEQIVTSITKLTLLEVAELSDVLKKRLNLPDAPVMNFGAVGALGASAAAAEEAVEESTQTSFTVKLLKFDPNQKIALIKEIKNLLPSLNLVQAKKFVEAVPNLVSSDIGKKEAEDMKAALEKVGGVCEIN